MKLAEQLALLTEQNAALTEQVADQEVDNARRRLAEVGLFKGVEQGSRGGNKPPE